MSAEEDDLDHLLSLQDRVIETPPASPSAHSSPKIAKPAKSLTADSGRTKKRKAEDCTKLDHLVRTVETQDQEGTLLQTSEVVRRDNGEDELERTVFMSNIPYFVQYQDVYNRFKEFGGVERIKFGYRECFLRFLRCAIVVMGTKREASDAIEKVNFEDQYPHLKVNCCKYTGQGINRQDDDLDISEVTENCVYVNSFPKSMNKYLIWQGLEELFKDCGEYKDMTFLKVAKLREPEKQRRWVKVWFATKEGRRKALECSKKVLCVNVKVKRKPPPVVLIRE